MSNVLTYGEPSDPLIDAARKNFPNAGLRGFSLCTTPIEILDPQDENKTFSRGTGFFYRNLDGRGYLITCWHVVSGRDFFSRECLSNTGFEPTKIAYYGAKIEADSSGSTKLLQKRIVIGFPEVLQEYIRSGPPNIAGVPVDLFAFPVDPEWIFSAQDASPEATPQQKLSKFINEQNQSYLSTNAGDDCYILGYPLANYVGFRPPVWKRASIASDTALPFAGRPIFLVDGNTLPGLSGAPIIRMERVLVETAEGSGEYNSLDTSLLVGVYAGRLTSPDYKDTMIGYGWYTGLIPDLLERTAIDFTPEPYVVEEAYDYHWRNWTDDPFFSGDQAVLASFRKEPNGSWTLIDECNLVGPGEERVIFKPMNVSAVGQQSLWGTDLFTYLNDALARENQRRKRAFSGK